MARSFVLSMRNVAETLAICWPTVVDAGFARVTKGSCDARLARWSKRVVDNARIRLEATGLEHWDTTQAFVVMSNHRSHYDIPVLYALLGGTLRMVAKAELFRVPIFGAAMRESGFIEVDRKHRQRALASLEVARERLAGGVSVWIAPEGTRSRTGELLPFKKGGFHMAIDMGLPVLPIAIDGTRRVMDVDSARTTTDVDVRVTVAPPIVTAPYAARGKDGLDALVSDVRAAIARGLS
jgi:1-acyl-sn-glycerol-3-phosphate acyltransferase